MQHIHWEYLQSSDKFILAHICSLFVQPSIGLQLILRILRITECRILYVIYLIVCFINYHYESCKRI